MMLIGENYNLMFVFNKQTIVFHLGPVDMLIIPNIGLSSRPVDQVCFHEEHM